MLDIFVGVVIVSICIGSIYGTVYGWLMFGSWVLLTGIVDVIIKHNRDKP